VNKITLHQYANMSNESIDFVKIEIHTNKIEKHWKHKKEREEKIIREKTKNDNPRKTQKIITTIKYHKSYKACVTFIVTLIIGLEKYTSLQRTKISK
jgi:hypothetical protein